MLCRDSRFNVCVGFPFKDKGRLAIGGGNRASRKPKVFMTQRKKCPSGTGRRVEPENFATQEFFNRLTRSPSYPLSQGYFIQLAIRGRHSAPPITPRRSDADSDCQGGFAPSTPSSFGIAQKNQKASVFHKYWRLR